MEDYPYLGRTVSFSGGMKKEIWGSFWALKGIFEGDMSVRAKVKIMKSAQTWALTNTQVED